MLISKIRADVYTFLNGFSQINQNDFHFEVLSKFPVSCCEYSSMLLARFLIEEKKYNIADILMIKGQYVADSDQLHLWLKINGIVVDITAGQFEVAKTQVVIDDLGKWHDRWFKLIDIYFPEINFDDYLGYCDEQVLEYDYQQILKKISRRTIE